MRLIFLMAVVLAPSGALVSHAPSRAARAVARGPVLRGSDDDRVGSGPPGSDDKRVRLLGDTVMLSGLSLYQQGLGRWIGSLDALWVPAPFNLGSAFIRGCRLALCVAVCERLLKAVRNPSGVILVPVPIEAAGLAMLLNLALEYLLYFQPTALPSTLASSLGGTPADVVAAYLSIIVWRSFYASRGK